MFRYKITFFDEISNKQETEGGILAAESYGTAANRLVEIYGKDNVDVIGLYELDNCLNDDDLREVIDNEVKF